MTFTPQIMVGKKTDDQEKCFQISPKEENIILETLHKMEHTRIMKIDDLNILT